MISAVILTKNEEVNIAKCIKSLLWCDEIIVVDDYSTDETIERVRGPASPAGRQESEVRNINKYKIFERRLNNDFAKQRNFGLEKAKGEWVIFIDADEIISEVLASEIEAQISNIKDQNQSSKFKTDQIVGFYLKRRDFFLGRWLKYGETANVRLLRLAKKNSGKWKGKVHEKWLIKGKTEVLNNPLEHYPHSTMTIFLQKINTYTDIVAQYWKEKGRKINSPEIFIYPLGKFLHNYLIKLGFLDGVPGFIMAVMMSFHSFLARGKYWLMVNKHE